MISRPLAQRYLVYFPVVFTSGSMAIRALFPILGAYFFSQQDYVDAVAIVGVLSIAGMLASLEFHSIIIRELSKNTQKAGYRRRAVLKNLATAFPRVLLGVIFIWILISPIIDGKLDYPKLILLLPVIVFLDLILCESSRIHNATGEFVAGTILTNTKNIGWIFILPIMLLAGCSVLDSILLSYGLSFVILIFTFSKDFKIRGLLALPKFPRKNSLRFFVTFRGSIFLLLVGWIGLFNPMVERYALALSGNSSFSVNFFFMGSLAAIGTVLASNIALIPFHSTLISPINLDKIVVVGLIKRILVTCFSVVASLGCLFYLAPEVYFPEGIEKNWGIFVPLLIASQITVIGSFFSIRLYAAKADLKLFVISILDFLMRVGLVFVLIRIDKFHYIPFGVLWLSAIVFLVRMFVYQAVKIR